MKKIISIGLVLIMLSSVFLVILPTNVSATGGWTFEILDSPIAKELNGVAWKPDGSYALIVGEGGTVLKYDGTTLTALTSGTSADLQGIAWKPDGSYALIVGAGKTILKYDGTSFTSLQTADTDYLYRDITWKPDGSYALIVGDYWAGLWWNGLTQKTTTGSYLSSVESGTYCRRGVDWKPDESYALIVGFNGQVSKYDGSTVSSLSSGVTDEFCGVDWKDTGDYALLVSHYPRVIKYTGGNNFVQLSCPTTQKLHEVAWQPNEAYALIVGDNGKVMSCDGTTVTNLSAPTSEDLYDVAWKADGTCALIVGYTGTILKYWNPLPTAVTLSSPSSITSSSITLSWSQSPDTDFSKYEVHKSTTSGFTPSAITLVTTVTTKSTTTDTVGDLSELTTYYFKIRVIDIVDQYIDSNQVSATTSNAAPPAVTLNTPSDITNSAIGLSWTQNTNTDFSKYEIHKSTTSGFIPSSTTLYTTITSQTTTSTTVTGLIEGTTYYFKVRVLDAGGLYTDSNEVSGTTTNVVSPTSVTIGTPSSVTSGSLQLTWTQNADPDFSKYEIHKSTSSGFVPSSTTLHATITSQTTTSTTISGLSEATTYYFKVRVIDCGGLYTDSSEISATTQNVVPSSVTLSNPSSITSSSVVLTWSQNTNADFARYEIYQSTSSGFAPSSATLYTYTRATNSIAITLPYGTYYWRLKARDIAGNIGSWCTARFFVITDKEFVMYRSNNGGATWEEVENGVKHIFSKYEVDGYKDLRYKFIAVDAHIGLDRLTLRMTLIYRFFLDTDKDNLMNWDEWHIHHTDWESDDTDNDGLSDWKEVIIYWTNPLSEDTDGDGLTDIDEITVYKTRPRVKDTDNDWIDDGKEVKYWESEGYSSQEAGKRAKIEDYDGDGMLDGKEIKYSKNVDFSIAKNPNLGLKPIGNDASDDNDGDGIINIDEVNKYYTDPTTDTTYSRSDADHAAFLESVGLQFADPPCGYGEGVPEGVYITKVKMTGPEGSGDPYAGGTLNCHLYQETNSKISVTLKSYNGDIAQPDNEDNFIIVKLQHLTDSGWMDIAIDQNINTPYPASVTITSSSDQPPDDYRLLWRTDFDTDAPGQISTMEITSNQQIIYVCPTFPLSISCNINFENTITQNLYFRGYTTNGYIDGSTNANMILHKPDGTTAQISTRTQQDKHLYQNSEFCYRLGDNLAVGDYTLDLKLIETDLCGWQFHICTAGWDDPSQHDLDSDGLTDYQEADMGTHPETKNDRYAVLIVGSEDEEVAPDLLLFWEDLKFMYGTLIQDYNYKEDDIYVLYLDGTDKESTAYGQITDYPATKTDIQTVFNILAAPDKMDSNDLLYVWVSSHGYGYDSDVGYKGGQIEFGGDESNEVQESSFKYDGRDLADGDAEWYDLDADGQKDDMFARISGVVKAYLDADTDGDLTTVENWNTVIGEDKNVDGIIDSIDNGVNLNNDADRNDYVGIDETIELSNDGRLSDDDLKSCLSSISCNRITIVLGQCYSGGFILDLSSTNRIILTACAQGEPSKPTTEGYSAFLYCVCCAFHKKDIHGAEVNADANADGFISVKEAFDYANRPPITDYQTPKCNDPSNLAKYTYL